MLSVSCHHAGADRKRRARAVTADSDARDVDAERVRVFMCGTASFRKPSLIGGLNSEKGKNDRSILYFIGSP